MAKIFSWRKFLAIRYNIIFIMQRLEIFRQQVIEEKERLGIKTSRSDRQPATYITIHRAKILDDGYAQLSLLHMKALKGTIRVKFVNEQVHRHVYQMYCTTSMTLAV